MRPIRVIALNDLLISLKARETFLIGLLMPALMMLPVTPPNILNES